MVLSSAASAIRGAVVPQALLLRRLEELGWYGRALPSTARSAREAGILDSFSTALSTAKSVQEAGIPPALLRSLRGALEKPAFLRHCFR